MHRHEGARSRHRAPLVHRPAQLYFWGAALLTFACGMAVAGVHEAYLAHDHLWLGLFIALAVGGAVLYFAVVAWWLDWISPTDD